jgi:hypothetical protein
MFVRSPRFFRKQIEALVSCQGKGMQFLEKFILADCMQQISTILWQVIFIFFREQKNAFQYFLASKRRADPVIPQHVRANGKMQGRSGCCDIELAQFDHDVEHQIQLPQKIFFFFVTQFKTHACCQFLDRGKCTFHAKRPFPSGPSSLIRLEANLIPAIMRIFQLLQTPSSPASSFSDPAIPGPPLPGWYFHHEM